MRMRCPPFVVAAVMVLALGACRERVPAVVQLGAPVPYRAAAESGRAVAVRVDGAVTGYADAAFGVHRLPAHDALVYRRIVTWRPGAYDSARTDAVLVLRTGAGTRVLASVLPHFEDGFARPVFRGDTVYYWGLRRAGLYVGTLYAMRAVLPDGAVDSLQLGGSFGVSLGAVPARGPELRPDGVLYAYDGRRRAMVRADFRSWWRAE